MQTFITNSYKETEEFASNFSKNLHPGDVIAYEGSMGMGKTVFTRGIVKGLGGDDVVSSPTFALVNEYETPLCPVYHFDMYRVNTYDDLYSTGFFDYLENGSILLIEWSENIYEALPENTVFVNISKGEEENKRTITIRSMAEE